MNCEIHKFCDAAMFQREASLILAKGAQAGLNTSNYLWIVTQVIIIVIIILWQVH